jgi:hypothetical protein
MAPTWLSVQTASDNGERTCGQYTVPISQDEYPEVVFSDVIVQLEFGGFGGEPDHGVDFHKGELRYAKRRGPEVRGERFADLVGDEAVGTLEIAVLER